MLGYSRVSLILVGARKKSNALCLQDRLQIIQDEVNISRE